MSANPEEGTPGSVLPVGDGALRLETEDTSSAAAAAARVRDAAYDGVRDVICGLRSVLVVFDPRVADAAVLAARLRATDRSPVPSGWGRRIAIPVCFDGPDLDEVAHLSGLGARGVVEALTTTELAVAVLGFSPGFAYLSGLPEGLAKVPRRTSPRPSVPAGSVALAGGYAAVYPQQTPGGWQVVGRTELSLFDPLTPPYARLASGDRVALVEVPAASTGTAGQLPARRIRAPWRSVAAGRPTFVVEHPGTFTTVQDAGRVGLGHLGVPAAGAADPVSARLANALVGNGPGAPCLEIAGSGPVLSCRAAGYVAVVGGEPGVWLDGSEVLPGRVVPVTAGQRLSISAPRHGMRTYLAAAGGLCVPAIMGSSSTDVLSWLGPGPLQSGDEIGIAGPIPALADHLLASAAGPAPAGRRVLRVVPGPEASWLQGGVVQSLAARRFVVESLSDRVGVRMRIDDDAGPLARRTGEVSSAGMVTGAVQLPPSGQPIVLLPDHATLGGYPVVAVVVTADLGQLGQCAPGEEVLLASVTLEEAGDALSALDRWLAQAVAGRYPVRPG
ncbi:MAG TPA: 5-oxoprolinase/urea amidolyase family protein [Acidimicrobiales bacterium]|nr:5-oxoprolinase/urea amidolyase family protein [Acidimicrobiales bacterium]